MENKIMERITVMKPSEVYTFIDASYDKQLFVEEKNTHGTTRFYPDCNVSKFLLVIKRRSSFNEDDLKELNKYGFSFHVKSKAINFNRKGDRL